MAIATTTRSHVIPEFVEHANFYKFDGLYVINGHKIDRPGIGMRAPGENGSVRGRQGFVWVSPDFEHWLPESAESFTLPEPHDHAKRGYRKTYDQVHLRTAPLVYRDTAVGLYSIWHNHEYFANISGDFGLSFSTDGLHFHEPVKGRVFLSANDSPVTQVPDKHYLTVLCQANGFLNVGGETRIYHGRWRNVGYLVNSEAELEEYYAEVGLAVIPRNRWGAPGLAPGETSGSFITAPIMFIGDSLQVAINGDDLEGVTVEVIDERFADYLQTSGKLRGVLVERSGLSVDVEWSNADALSKLKAGSAIRLRVRLSGDEGRSPKVYAIYIQ